jgi:threonine synthase
MTQATLSTTTAAKGLACKECGAEYELKPVHICEFCFGPLEVQYDYEYLKTFVTRERIQSGPNSIWRYKDLLPVAKDPIDVGTGASPRLEEPLHQKRRSQHAHFEL